jgi:hypothetical protein
MIDPSEKVKFGLFSTQPKLKVVGSDGRPLLGKYAIAYSWIEPKLETLEGEDSFITAKKYFSLQNVVSDPYAINGIAEFRNLTLTGAFDLCVYILFSID